MTPTPTNRRRPKVCQPIPHRSAVLTHLAVAISALTLAACGSGDSQPTNTGTAESAGRDRTQPVQAKPQKPANVVKGQFEGTPGNGYTLEVSYDLGRLDTQIDIANAQPGEAILSPATHGELTFTNTTPSRNTEFQTYEAPSINLFWERSQIPSSYDCSGGLHVGGAVHCYLIGFHGDPDLLLPTEGVVELGPDEAMTLPLDPELTDGATVAEQDANAIAKLIRSTPPSLVTLLIDGLEPSYDTCEYGPSEITAVLTGTGEVLADGGEGESC